MLKMASNKEEKLKCQGGPKRAGDGKISAGERLDKFDE